jgi:hypothetical protein
MPGDDFISFSVETFSFFTIRFHKIITVFQTNKRRKNYSCNKHLHTLITETFAVYTIYCSSVVPIHDNINIMIL